MGCVTGYKPKDNGCYKEGEKPKNCKDVDKENKCTKCIDEDAYDLTADG